MDTITITTTILSNVLNGQTKEQYISLVIFAIIGLLISALVELIRARRKIVAKGGFSLSVWFSDNWQRSILSILIISVGVLFSPEIGKFFGLDINLSNKGALVTGFMTDKIVEALLIIDLKALLNKALNKQ